MYSRIFTTRQNKEFHISIETISGVRSLESFAFPLFPLVPNRLKGVEFVCTALLASPTDTRHYGIYDQLGNVGLSTAGIVTKSGPGISDFSSERYDQRDRNYSRQPNKPLLSSSTETTAKKRFIKFSPDLVTCVIDEETVRELADDCCYCLKALIELSYMYSIGFKQWLRIAAMMNATASVKAGSMQKIINATVSEL